MNNCPQCLHGGVTPNSAHPGMNSPLTHRATPFASPPSDGHWVKHHDRKPPEVGFDTGWGGARVKRLCSGSPVRPSSRGPTARAAVSTLKRAPAHESSAAGREGPALPLSMEIALIRATPGGLLPRPAQSTGRYKRALAASWACWTALLTHSSRETQRDSSETTFLPNSLPCLVLTFRDPCLRLRFQGTWPPASHRLGAEVTDARLVFPECHLCRVVQWSAAAALSCPARREMPVGIHRGAQAPLPPSLPLQAPLSQEAPVLRTVEQSQPQRLELHLRLLVLLWLF